MDFITTYINADKVFLARRMQKFLPRHIFKLLKDIGAQADNTNERIFAVGGFVRDLLLDNLPVFAEHNFYPALSNREINVDGVYGKGFDIDLVTEANAIDFARGLAGELNATLVAHKRFGTASIFVPGATKRDAIRIDMATARREFYERPAALPKVQFATIKEDLFRRDFTINAMAISLNRATFGQLVDFFGGWRDLRAKKIRVLHDLSFIDDPTRIFRAVRFQQRLGLKIEQRTQGLIRHAIGLDMFAKTQKQRLRNEIILILNEPNPLKAVLKMLELDELRFIHPRLKADKNTIKLFKQVDAIYSWFLKEHFKKRKIDKWLLYFLALTDRLSYEDVKKICGDFVFTKGDEKKILLFKKNGVKLIKYLDSRAVESPSEVYKTLESLPYEVILMCMAEPQKHRIYRGNNNCLNRRKKIKDADYRDKKRGLASEKIKLFLERYNGVRLHIDGDDLKAMGAAPGPQFKRILEEVLYSKLDGKIGDTKQAEIEFAKRLI